VAPFPRTGKSELSRTRRIALALFVSAPIATLLIAGAWALVESGRLFWLGWIFPVCWGAAWFVARKRHDEPDPLPRLGSRVPAYWTKRDREAGQLIDARIKRTPDIPIERLTEPRFYLDAGIDLAHEIARHYHPRSKDPVGPLRITEIVAALNLATEDLERRIEEYVPGSHIVTVDQWRMLARSPKWRKCRASSPASCSRSRSDGSCSPRARPRRCASA
jgi:hypothetical protein